MGLNPKYINHEQIVDDATGKMILIAKYYDGIVEIAASHTFNEKPDANHVAMASSWLMKALEAKYGIALTVRTAAALTASDAGLGPRLATVGGGGNEIATAELMLWPRGAELRQRALQSYNPFQPQALTDAALARTLLLDDFVPTIQLADPEWQTQLAEALAERGLARLTADKSEESRLRTEAVRLIGEPVDVDFFQFFPTLEAFKYSEDGGATLEFSLRERI